MFVVIKCTIKISFEMTSTPQKMHFWSLNWLIQPWGRGLEKENNIKIGQNVLKDIQIFRIFEIQYNFHNFITVHT